MVEIVERGGKTSDTAAGSVIVPDEVRINGTSILCPDDCPVTVHEITADGSSLALVTLTMYARRVVIGAELDD